MATANGRANSTQSMVWTGARTLMLAVIVVTLGASCIVGDDDAQEPPTPEPGATQVGDELNTPEPVAASPAVGLATSPTVAPVTAACPAPASFSDAGVQISLQPTFSPGPFVSFGLPLLPGAVTDADTLSVTAGGQHVEASVQVLLATYGPDGAPTGPRSVLVQFPTTVLQGDCTVVDIAWQGSGAATGGATIPYAEVSADSDEIVDTAVRTIEEQGGQAVLVETSQEQRVLFTAREPTVLATFPDGYLAATGLFGHLVAASQIGDELAGLRFISEQITPFGLSAMFQESYALNPIAVVGPDDLTEDAEGFEAWLYDRCATFLLFAAHTGDIRFLREGYRSCSYYASKIELSGEYRGIFTGKPEPDTKYSHLRGLYIYYALTGDETALAAGEAIAELWLSEQDFVAPYRAGHLRGPDKLWTERLLGTSIEGLYYGHLLTGTPEYLRATEQMVATAYQHITGDEATLAEINPGSAAFPPQNCFIHNASQAAEGNEDEPFCSGWMPVLLVDPLLAYQDQTGDARVDEIFIRLTRFLRDTGTSYHRGDIQTDDFFHPAIPYDPNDSEVDRRMLVPLYGAGIDQDGERQHYGEYDDFQHCLDATALTAAGLRALQRAGGYDQNPVGPFASEGESFLALHHELAFCAYATFIDQTRLNRDPANFDSEELAEGLDDPETFIEENRIGYQSHNVSPQRKLSWWFNTTLEQYVLLSEAGISVPELRPGVIQP